MGLVAAFRLRLIAELALRLRHPGLQAPHQGEEFEVGSGTTMRRQGLIPGRGSIRAPRW
jgi:hypothetical protein